MYFMLSDTMLSQLRCSATSCTIFLLGLDSKSFCESQDHHLQNLIYATVSAPTQHIFSFHKASICINSNLLFQEALEFLSLPGNGNGTSSTAPPHGSVNDREKSGPREAFLAPCQIHVVSQSLLPQKCQVLVCDAGSCLRHYNRHN